MAAPSGSVAQRLVGYLLRYPQDTAAFESLLEAFPDPKDIPLADPDSLAIFESLYESGGRDFDRFDRATNGAFHDALLPLVSGAAEGDGRRLISELTEESNREKLLLQVSKSVADLTSGLVSSEKVRSELYDISSKLRAPSENKNFVQVVDEAKASLTAILDSGVELSTGLVEVDKLFTFRRGMVNVIAAATSQGKTALACRQMLRGAEAKKPLKTAYLAFEDHATLPYKLASQMFKVPLEHFTRYHLATAEQRANVDVAMDALKQYKDSIHVFPPMPLGAFEAEVRQIKPDILVLDYIQRYIERYAPAEGKREAIGQVADHFHRLVEQTNSFGFLLSQIRRRENTKGGYGPPRRPQLFDLKESGDLENYADSVFLLWWPWKDRLDEEAQLDRTKYHIEIAKDKLGKCGDIVVNFNGEVLNLEDRYQIAR